MKNLLKSKVLFLLILFSPTLIFSQTPPPLGVAADFVLFTSIGALSIVGASQITGNVGTDVGAFVSTVNVNGQTHIGDAISAQCALDITTAYNNLSAQPTGMLLGVVLGSGQTLLPNVYQIPGAGTAIGPLILDGGGDPNACFVFKVDGAFAAAASSSVILINGAKACNVFWRVDGATAIATNSSWKGTIICFGAIAFAIGFEIDGKILATGGAISVSGITAGSYGCDGSSVSTGPTGPVFATIDCFALLTSNGTVTNTGATNIVGDIGTNLLTVSGFNPTGVAGTIHSAPNISTAQASSDLAALYAYLNALPIDIQLLYPLLFGHSQVLTPHVYLIDAAAVLTDTIFLDGQGNSNAIFVIRIRGALTTGASPQVVLLRGTQSNNVFWQVEGDVNISSNANFKGIIISNNASIILNSGVVLNGKALSTTGNITTQDANITTPACTILLPIDLLSFTATTEDTHVQINWSTTSETNNDYFNIERSTDGVNFSSIEKINGGGNSTQPLSYSSVDHPPIEGWCYYRLREMNFNGNVRYSNIVAVDFHKANDFIFHTYPNPFSDKTTFRISQKLNHATLTVYNSCGHIVKEIKNISGRKITLYRDKLPNGIYIIRLTQDNAVIATRKLVIID
jgi:hypothetical protein